MNQPKYRSTAHRAVHFAALGTLLLLLAATPALATSPWQLLGEMRQDLEGQRLAAKFVQTYVPAGFSSGDQEKGGISLWLPRCLHWNYTEPYEKHFLLCDGEVYAWNEGEDSGQRYSIQAEREPGLDLLLEDIDTLRERYSAESRQLADGTYEVILSQRASGGRLRAKIRLDPTNHRVLGMEYTDSEANLTRFELSNYTEIDHDGLFRPPANIEWSAAE